MGIILLITGIVIVLAGIIVNRLYPSICSIWDGMWYAWVTIPHTVYGDIVPKTTSARFFGGILILPGVVLVTVFTANLSAFLIDSSSEDEKQDTKKLNQETEVTYKM